MVAEKLKHQGSPEASAIAASSLTLQFLCAGKETKKSNPKMRWFKQEDAAGDSPSGIMLLFVIEPKISGRHMLRFKKTGRMNSETQYAQEAPANRPAF